MKKKVLKYCPGSWNPSHKKMFSIYKASWSDVMVISFSLLLSCFNVPTTWKKYHNNGSLQKPYYYNSNHNRQLSTTYLFGITSPRLTREWNENHLYILTLQILDIICRTYGSCYKWLLITKSYTFTITQPLWSFPLGQNTQQIPDLWTARLTIQFKPEEQA